MAPSTRTLAVLPATRPGPCLERGGLPDPLCTPGAVDLRVTPADERQTICASGYPSAVSPSPATLRGLAAGRLSAYGIASGSYELDRLIPADLGGSTTDPANLWPQPTQAAAVKDRLEVYLHARVCSGTLSLRQAQADLSRSWLAAYERYLAH